MIQKEVLPAVSDEEKRKSKNEAQAKNAIFSFLTELGVDKIIYVDDRCSIHELKEVFVGGVKALYDEKPDALDFLEWTLPVSVFNNKITEIWDAADDDRKREFFTKLLVYQNNQDDIDNSIAPLTLKVHLKDKIDLLSPTEWVLQKDQIIQLIKDGNKILFLFDIEFKYAPLADQRDGKDLAVELLSHAEISKNIYCGIFSHLFSLEEENDKRNEFCKTHHLNKLNFYTISKKRFNDGGYLPGLAEGIRNTLLINEVESLKERASKIISNANKDALIEIKKLTPESFNHIIQKSSLYEGAWEMATLLRLNNIITSDKALRKLLISKNRANINEDLAKIRKIENISTGGQTPTNKSEVKELREKEIFVGKDILNQLHYPVSNGDIFNINSKEYILLAQPCNLALRKGGARDRKYDTGFLIPLEKIDQAKFDEYKKGQLSTLELIENPDMSGGELKIAKFSEFLPVSLLPLDLTVFNEDGKASIDLSQIEHQSKTIQASWKLRYKKVHKELQDYKKSVTTYLKLRSTTKTNLKSTIYYGGIFKNYNIDNTNALKGNKLLFDITRVLHYKAPYSSDLLQKFMQYLSRNAFDHDFLNKV
jgi:hypothetical protein